MRYVCSCVNVASGCDLSFFLSDLTPSYKSRSSSNCYKCQKSKKEKLGSLISNEQAMPFMLPEGKLTTEIDANYFMRKAPFYCLYDE